MYNVARCPCLPLCCLGGWRHPKVVSICCLPSWSSWPPRMSRALNTARLPQTLSSKQRESIPRYEVDNAISCFLITRYCSLPRKRARNLISIIIGWVFLIHHFVLKIKHYCKIQCSQSVYIASSQQFLSQSSTTKDIIHGQCWLAEPFHSCFYCLQWL